MAPVSEPRLSKIKIADISVDLKTRLRPATQSGVDSLIASIEELGVIKDPIHLRKVRRRGKEKLVLMAGLHRLTAATQLGWTTIPARVWQDVTDNFARLMEIDDNLAGADLSPLELSVFLAERKKVYEAEHPETKAGTAGAMATNGVATEIISFAASVAEKRDLSERHIRNFVKIGSTLSPSDVAVLRSAETPIKLTDLMDLAKIPEDRVRGDVIDRIRTGKATTIKAGWDQAVGRKTPPKPSKADAAFAKLMEAWKRAPMDAKRRFAEEVSDDLAALLDQKPALKVVG